MFLSEFVIKPTSISCWLLKFCVICFCFQKNVVYIFPAISGWGNQIFWSTRPNLSCVGRLVFGLILWKWMNGVDSLGSNQECRIGYRHSHSRVCRIGYRHSHSRVSQSLASIRKLGNRRSSEGLKREQICLFLSSWLGISKWTQVPSFNVAYANSTVRHRIDFLNVRNAKNASMLHAQTLVTTKS